jgi:hypothetical protein
MISDLLSMVRRLQGNMILIFESGRQQMGYKLLVRTTMGGTKEYHDGANE